MTEDQYIILSNRVKVETALKLLCDVMASDAENWGVGEGDLPDTIDRLYDIQTKLFNLTVIDDKKGE